MCPTVKLILLVISFILATTFAAHAQRARDIESFAGRIFFKETNEGEYRMRHLFAGEGGTENPRLVAIALDISLGLFGMHRLYLGTDLLVPITYTFTMGGGCVLWLVDLGLLIFSKDLKPYMNNPHVFMWVRN